MSTDLAPTVPLRLARTRAAAARRERAVVAGVAAGAVALGLWQALGVENGALGTVSGLALVGLAPSLARGRRRAHRLACLAALVACATTAAGSHGSRELSVTLAVTVALVLAAPAFHATGDPSTRGALLWAAVAAALAAVADVARAGGLLGHPVIATALALAGALALRSLRPWPATAATDADRAQVRRMIEGHARDSLAPFALRADKRYFFTADRQAFLAYSVVAGVAVVSGDAVGAPAAIAGLLTGFVREARRRGWVPAALGQSADQVALWRALGFHAHYTGDEAVMEPASFSLDGRAIRKVRQSVTRLERCGYRVEVRRTAQIDDALAAELGAVAERWRAGRRETGFSMAFESAAVDRARDDVYAIALDPGGAVGGFLHLGVVPAARTLSLSGMRRERDTPNGLNEYLICSLLAWAAREGFEQVSLNFAAFARVLDPAAPLDRLTRLERSVLRRLAGRFQLERLERFNAKFDPVWVPRYLAYPRVSALPRIALAAMLAEAYVARPRWRRR